MDALDLTNCKHEVENKILKLEGQVLSEITGIKSDVTTIKRELEKLVTRMEFEPIRMLVYGLVGGVLIAALGAIMAKVVGW